MEEEETLQERQENELVLLQAIFMDAFEDLRKKDTWKVWRPPEVQITLQPQQSMTEHKEIYAQVDLHVKCFEDYPERPPEITLKNAKGLSNIMLEQLNHQLQEVATRLKGEVMILELTQFVQKFLHENNKAPAKSFYEEMVSNQRKLEEEQAKAELRKQELERIRQELQHKEIQEEINRKQEALRQARRRRSFSRNFNNEESSSFVKVDATKSLSSSPTDVHFQSVPLSLKSENVLDRRKQSCGHNEVISLTFHDKVSRTVQRGRCLAHGPRGCVTFLGMDAHTGEMMIVIEWVLKLSPFKKKMTSEEQETYQKQRDSYLKQISFADQDIATFSKLNHKNLGHYFGLQHSIERDQITVQVLQEHINGCSLATYLSSNLPLEMALLRHYAQAAVESLNYLHENSVIHRDLRATSLLLDNTGTVKMIDYSIDKRLFDLYNSTRKEPINDEYPPATGRGGKKGDVHRLGIMLLSVSRGCLVTDIFPSVPNTLPPEFQSFLKACLQPNEKERWTFGQLLDHTFLKPKLLMDPSPEKIEMEEARNIGMNPEPVMNSTAINSEPFGSTRIDNEFEVLQWLGKGGFGDVLKVRNKLDGRVYALKRILLNPSRQLLNRKIMREVKLLSRLNHENVVRYYNSWIESTTEVFQDESSTDVTISQPPAKNNVVSSTATTETSDDIEKLAPPKVEGSVDWSMSIDFGSQVQEEEEDSSDEDDYEAGVFGTVLSKPDNSESVLFEHDESKTSSDILKTSSLSTGAESKSCDRSSPRLMQFMFIQMEFCEKSTLRTAIDEGLYAEPQRMWRLFREVIEGLLHIHQQGMIHRDLKPVNIFLDSYDHVKIGDFGLATTDMVIKSSLLDSSNPTCSSNLLDVSVNEVSEFLGDGTQTGRVGTALYVAPELIATSSTKIIYNQKVDIYSLGIIFFEMCYPAPSTGMERIKLLINLRRYEIVLPSDADLQLTPQQIRLIKWLLQHNVTQRPSAEELLASDYLPPPHLEEAELNEMLRHTVSNPQSRAYKRMIKSLFRQDTTAVGDFSYDMDLYKSPHNARYTWAFNAVANTIHKVMHRHGAVLVSVPTLMPKCGVYEQSEYCVSLMDHSGGIITLPNDLRVSFARYVARREVHHLKRYAIEKVYRERKVYGCHPREVYECAFDIVTQSHGSFLPDAEVITVIAEIIAEFPVLQAREYYLRINHKNLLASILIFCGILEEQHPNILALLSDAKARAGSKLQFQTKLQSLGVSDQSVAQLFQFIEVEDTLQRIQALTKPVTKKRGRNTSLASHALRELETIVSHVEAFGVKLPIVVAPGLVFGINTYSGVLFQFVCELNKKNHKVKMDMLAAGGRYDSLISNFRLSSLSGASRETASQAVGVSIALEKICSGYVEQENSTLKKSGFDVMICSVGSLPMLKEKCHVLQGLWARGIHAQVVYDCSLSLEEVTVLCRDMSISHILILKDVDSTHIKLRTLEKDRFTEKKISLSELMDYIDQLEGSIGSKQEVFRNSNSADVSERLSSSSITSSHVEPSVKISFLPLEKIPGANKRRHDSQIQTYLASILPQLATRANVEVLAVDVGATVIRNIASCVELDFEEDEFKSSLSVIIEKHPRHRKYLAQLWDFINTIRLEKKYFLLALYSLVDSSCKVIFKAK